MAHTPVNGWKCSCNLLINIASCNRRKQNSLPTSSHHLNWTSQTISHTHTHERPLVVLIAFHQYMFVRRRIGAHVPKSAYYHLIPWCTTNHCNYYIGRCYSLVASTNWTSPCNSTGYCCFLSQIANYQCYLALGRSTCYLQPLNAIDCQAVLSCICQAASYCISGRPKSF